MPLSTTEVLERIDAAIAKRYSHTDPIGAGRRLFLEHLRELVMHHGIPFPAESKIAACIMPHIFQELNYDGYDWSNRNVHFGRLSDLVALDVIIWSDDRTRCEVSDKEFADYNRFCDDAITFRSQQ